MTRPGKAWKTTELEIARDLGTVRVLRQGTDAPDAKTAGWAIETKHRKALPGWLWEFVAQARRNAKGLRPAVAMVESRRGIKKRRLVLLEWPDFLALMVAAGEVPPTATPALTSAVESAEQETADDAPTGDAPAGDPNDD